MSKYICLLFTWLLIGCSSAIQHIPNPQAVTDPRAKIEEIIRSQPYEVMDVGVNDKFFKFTQKRTQRGMYGIAVGQYTQAFNVYYHKIDRHEIYARSNWFFVVLYDKSGRELCRIATNEENEARTFVDAVYAMKAAAH